MSCCLLPAPTITSMHTDACTDTPSVVGGRTRSLARRLLVLRRAGHGFYYTSVRPPLRCSSVPFDSDTRGLLGPEPLHPAPTMTPVFGRQVAWHAWRRLERMQLPGSWALSCQLAYEHTNGSVQANRIEWFFMPCCPKPAKSQPEP